MCFDIVNGVGNNYKANIFNNNFEFIGTSTGIKIMPYDCLLLILLCKSYNYYSMVDIL